MHAGETVPVHGEREEIMRLLFAEDDRLVISAALPRDRKPETPGITLML